MFGLEYAPLMAEKTAGGIDLDVAMKNMAESIVKIQKDMAKLGSAASEAATMSNPLSRGTTSRDFEVFARAYAHQNPTMTLERLIYLFDRDGPVALAGKDRSEVGRWILTQPDIVHLMKDKKINAIKEVRARTHIGLKEAKDGVEWAQAQVEAGWIPEEDRKKLEEEEQIAIQSILGIGSSEG